MGLRQLLGLRSPIHTVARMVNPLNAAFSINGVTHPPYMPVHQQGSRLMGERAMAVFKGDGGEVERDLATLQLVGNGQGLVHRLDHNGRQPCHGHGQQDGTRR